MGGGVGPGEGAILWWQEDFLRRSQEVAKCGSQPHLHHFWTVSGFSAEVCTFEFSGVEVEWGIRSVASLVAMGLLVPLALLVLSFLFSEPPVVEAQCKWTMQYILTSINKGEILVLISICFKLNFVKAATRKELHQMDLVHNLIYSANNMSIFFFFWLKYYIIRPFIFLSETCHLVFLQVYNSYFFKAYLFLQSR